MFLLAAVLAGFSAGALARDHAYDIKPGLRAVVNIDGAAEQRVSARVGKGAPQALARLDDETVDVLETPDIDHDGYRDLVIGQSGGAGQVHARLFLYRPQERRFQEIVHPAPDASPCHRFVNPVFDARRAAFTTGCRYGADRNGTEDYALRADGTARPLRWTTQALFDLEDTAFDLTYGFHEDGTVADIAIDGDGWPLDGDGTVPFDRLDLYDAPDVQALSARATKAGDRLDIIALRPHWQQDWRFDRFLSEGNGTIDSLSRLLVRSPVLATSQSSAASATFASNAFTPFLARGYRVVFVTSGAATWRNLGRFATHLGAQEFADQLTLRQRYPEAQPGAWGVPDEYMFRYIAERLARADRDGEPLFVVALSTTHHPPFLVPEGGQRGGLDLSDIERLPYYDSWSGLDEAFDTLRYANDQLGRFLTGLKASAQGARTIVAVTGDHNILGVDYAADSDIALARAVPFYLYVPPGYRGQSTYDPSRPGSHKDILPTLYHLSLPDTPYFRSGCDLLAARPDPQWCFGFNNPRLVITRDGAYQRDRPGRIQPWAGATGLALAPEQAASPAQAAEQARLGAYGPLLQWQINYQVQNQTSARPDRP
ncbi:LTA synthase family protein [Achromobacter ruhlandii]|nr:LTA synthase family protein [Achromobacter ruhlandii]